MAAVRSPVPTSAAVAAGVRSPSPTVRSNFPVIAMTLLPSPSQLPPQGQEAALASVTASMATASIRSPSSATAMAPTRERMATCGSASSGVSVGGSVAKCCRQCCGKYHSRTDNPSNGQSATGGAAFTSEHIARASSPKRRRRRRSARSIHRIIFGICIILRINYGRSPLERRQPLRHFGVLHSHVAQYGRSIGRSVLQRLRIHGGCGVTGATTDVQSYLSGDRQGGTAIAVVDGRMRWRRFDGRRTRSSGRQQCSA